MVRTGIKYLGDRYVIQEYWNNSAEMTDLYAQQRERDLYLEKKRYENWAINKIMEYYRCPWDYAAHIFYWRPNEMTMALSKS